MADTNSVSDTQVLLQSMLQRLRLQPKSENTHMQDEVQFGGTLIKQNGGVSGSPPQTPSMYKMDFSKDSRSIVTNGAGLLSPDSTGVPTSLSQEFAKGLDVYNSRLPSRPKQRALSFDYRSHRTVSGENREISTHADDGVTPKQTRQQKFSLINRSNSSVSSLQRPERLSSWTPISGQEESNIQNQGVEQKKWTQKVKERWKERHKISIKKDGRLEQTLSNSNISLISVQNALHGNSITTTFNEEVNVQHQPVISGSVEDVPSLLDHMSETLFSPGSFNLMEEIFTGQEWAKYLPSSTDSQSASSSITHDQEIGLKSSVGQSRQNDQNVLSRWDYREKTDTNVGITHQSPMNSEGFHTMDTSEHLLNHKKTLSFGQDSYNSQYRLSELEPNHLDLSGVPLGNKHLLQEQTSIYPNHQSNNSQPKVSAASSSEQNVNQSQMMEMNPNQHKSVHESLLVLDLSYPQPKDSTGMNKQVPPGRKRSHSTETDNSNEQWRWRNGSFSSISDPAPSLSPASSTSSLQYSIYQDSESYVATETVIKKRRVENTRHVRFADEVTIVPPLILSDDEGDAEDDEDYGQNGNMIHEEIHEGEKESPPQPNVPRWIEALRSKTKKPKLKFPRMRTKKYSFM
ncbi:hypothetical protein Baya_13327 [Bagarius yarrelli]|uniref:Uncharacterized protein n=1 Tax=Bagarius yarrelli TaxID=175774 RepID=A0A556V5P8_BAGYA|nr:hypothetical protein Baya_13327 [Bagarius yarrelli]